MSGTAGLDYPSYHFLKQEEATPALRHNYTQCELMFTAHFLICEQLIG